MLLDIEHLVKNETEAHQAAAANHVPRVVQLMASLCQATLKRAWSWSDRVWLYLALFAAVLCAT